MLVSHWILVTATYVRPPMARQLGALLLMRGMLLLVTLMMLDLTLGPVM